MKKSVWFDAREVNMNQEQLLSCVFNSSIDTLVINVENRRLYNAPKRTRYVVGITEKPQLQILSEDDVVMSADEAILEAAKLKKYKTCIYFVVNDNDSLESSWQAADKYDYAIIEFLSQTNIPLELIIARLQASDTILIKKVNTAEEAVIAFGVMEKGSDGIMLSTNDLAEVVKMNAAVSKMGVRQLSIVPGKVKSIEHIGMGYRACIDTTSLLSQEEGMLIGSTSKGGILVSSETHYLPYMNLRPFRVNAGAVHSYIWCQDDTTEYLTDLKAGSKVLVVDNNGNAREVSVGRVKIEKRPLLKIAVEVNGVEINTIVQDDWHIRVLGINGEPYNVSCLTQDTILAVYICEEGRHVGIKINESILEK